MRKGKGKNNRLLPNSLRIISSCIKTVSTNASTVVRSAGASVAASISTSGDDRKEQVLWAGFDRLELSQTAFRRVLLLGYVTGFQVFDVEDASGISELVSQRNGPVTFLQMLPAPVNFVGAQIYKSSHPILLVVGGDKDERVTPLQNTGHGLNGYGLAESSFGSPFNHLTAVRFYSMKSNEYVKVVDFRSPVFTIRCSPRVVAIGLEEQVHCFDTLTLEKKFAVVTYPIPHVKEQGAVRVNIGYGPLAVGPRWLAYSPSCPLMLNTSRVSPKSLASNVSPSTSPGNGTLMARYALESSKHLATGILTLGDMGYKKLSKHYPDLLPDGLSSPGWKTGKLSAHELENAGWVSVKDIDSSQVISQFRAHTSPIAALCFDPSGTLLITASVHGNNINIFRIMPSCTCSESSCNDWSTSYVHLYKIHRGITSAVIQDICFSHDSHWVGIVSSKGTCHIFVMSPFGGDDAFQGTSLFLSSARPWWSTSSLTINEPSYPPPPPCTLSVVSRIKCNDSGLLNSVSNAAASMVGKIWVPSGAVAAIFHNSGPNSLPNILVYAPSGFVVQHEIQPSNRLELSESRAESWSTLEVKSLQTEESRVKVEPVQWWDVCRRLDNVEREECISRSFFDGLNDSDIVGYPTKVSEENFSTAEKKQVKSDLLNSSERSHWYLSNAEVQINSYRLPIWQMPKVHFHVMGPTNAECCFGGEFEIEMVSSHEVEIRQKDLLPIFDHFPRSRSGWIDGYVPSDERDSSDSCQTREKTNEASVICHSKPPSFGSTESSEGGTEKTVDFGQSFKDGCCNKREFPDDRHSPTEVVNDAADNHSNDVNHGEEGWIGGMFDFSD